ncbi:MAG: ABC transporter permease, partial [Peptoniphilus sp.]|nr:ABC transporter permease [Peptoniphilus sp.]
MHISKRVFLYLTRKKGKNFILCIVFFLISFSLLMGSSVLRGISQISKDLRSTIGASFDIRPYEQFTAENGQVFSKGVPTISEASIQKILDIIGNELKTYNTEQSGYVKGKDISFIAGVGHSEDSNMGQIKAVRDFSLSKAFFNEEYRLIEGNHITPKDKNKILISRELAQANQLSVGDTISLTHAEPGNENSSFVTVEIKGIYEIKNNTDSGLNPTAKKTENIMFSDSQLLFDSGKQKIYNGEVSFFISDPLLLDEITQKAGKIASIDWENHIIEKNDFKFSKIAEQLESI